MAIFAQIDTLRQLPPNEKAVQERISVLQSFIIDNYYACVDEILRQSGRIYVYDDRMKRNIDQACGDDTAEFVRQAVLLSCSR